MDNRTGNTATCARVVTELAELSKRLKEKVILEGDLAKESQDLYNYIIATLYEAYGELYGWNKEENSDQEKGPKTNQ